MSPSPPTSSSSAASVPDPGAGPTAQPALEAAGAGTWRYDVATGQVHLDERCRALLWVDEPKAELVDAEHLLAALPPDEQDRFAAAAERIAASPSGRFDEVYRVLEAGGRVRWVAVRGRLYFDGPAEHRTPTYALGLMLDVTERRQNVLDELALERKRLQAVLDQMPSGLSIAEAPSGRLILHNDEAVRLLRHPLLASESIEGYAQYGALHDDGTALAPEEYPIARATRHGEVVRQETMHYRRGDGSRAILSVNAAPVRDADGTIVFAVSTFHDVTPRVTAEAALSRTRTHFRRALEDSGLVAARIDRDLRYVWIHNPHPDFDAAAVIGLRDDELDQGPGIDALMRLKREVIEQGATIEREITFQRSDGPRHYAVKGVPLRSDRGEVTGLTTLSRDVTEQRETERQLRTISRRLLQAQENERRRIARELHDEMGALLAALQMSLKMIQPATETGTRELSEAHSIAQTLIAHVRRLSLDLRPTVLDDLGLAPALHWFLNRFTERSGITVAFHHELARDERLPPELETAAYRIVQEAVTNAVRHAHADRLQVLVHRDDDHLVVHVIDEGDGFDVEAALHGRPSTGLSGMHERAQLVGGTLALESEPGVGTRVTARLPLQPNGTS